MEEVAEVGDNNAENEMIDESDLAHLDDLSGLPRSLIVASVPGSVFTNNSDKEAFEELFKKYDENATFEYFRTFKRCRVNFDDSEKATLARIHCHKLAFCGQEIKCFFAQKIEIPTNEENDFHLHPPALEKQFLISPPSSPPVGWEQCTEHEPTVVNFDALLLSRLASLAADESAHEIHSSDDANLPSIIVHTCKDPDDDSLPVIKPKIAHTPRPATGPTTAGGP